VPARHIIAQKSPNFRRKAALSLAIQFSIEEASLMKLIALSIPLVAIAVAVGVAAGGGSGSCGYGEDGRYVGLDGQISAFGTMSAVAECASEGKLPGVVAARLGTLGNADARQRAEEIKKLNAESKQRSEKEKAEQA
jgi:hypothetical protein